MDHQNCDNEENTKESFTKNVGCKDALKMKNCGRIECTMVCLKLDVFTDCSFFFVVNSWCSLILILVLFS